MSPLPTVTLATGTKVPQVAFGTALRNDPNQFEQFRAEGIRDAIKAGYVHLDGAAIYHTDPETGWAIKQSGAKREDLFITSKTHPSLGIARDDIESDLRRTLNDLQVDYVDLYLIHNPFFPNPKEFGIKEAWAQMEKLKELGLTKEIGVSNFEVIDLEKVLKVAKIKPAVNQIELHPSIYEESKPTIDFCKSHDITIEGYAPLVSLGRGSSRLSSSRLNNVVDDLSRKYSVTPAQVLVKWQIQRGFITVTSSMNDERRRTQIQLSGWDMGEDELLEIENAGREEPYRYFAWGGGKGSWGEDVVKYESVL